MVGKPGNDAIGALGTDETRLEAFRRSITQHRQRTRQHQRTAHVAAKVQDCALHMSQCQGELRGAVRRTQQHQAPQAFAQQSRQMLRHRAAVRGTALRDADVEALP